MKVRRCVKRQGARHSLSIRHVPPHDERNLLLSELLDSNLQRIRLALKINQDGRVHAVNTFS
jgi:hypothetical protein